MEEQHIHVHVHLHMEDEPDNTLPPLGQVSFGEQLIIDQLDALEILMTAVSDAIARLSEGLTALTGRIDEDMAHQADVIAQLRALVDAAAQTAATDAATIADLTAQADALVAESERTASDIDAITTAMSSIDPDGTFPAVADLPPVEEPPATE